MELTHATSEDWARSTFGGRAQIECTRELHRTRAPAAPIEGRDGEAARSQARPRSGLPRRDLLALASNLAIALPGTAAWRCNPTVEPEWPLPSTEHLQGWRESGGSRSGTSPELVRAGPLAIGIDPRVGPGWAALSRGQSQSWPGLSGAQSRPIPGLLRSESRAFATNPRIASAQAAPTSDQLTKCPKLAGSRPRAIPELPRSWQRYTFDQFQSCPKLAASRSRAIPELPEVGSFASASNPRVTQSWQCCTFD